MDGKERTLTECPPSTFLGVCHQPHREPQRKFLFHPFFEDTDSEIGNNHSSQEAEQGLELPIQSLVPHSAASDVAPYLCLGHGEESQSHYKRQGDCGEEKTHGRHRGDDMVGAEVAGVHSGRNFSSIQGQEPEIQISVADIMSPQGKAIRVRGRQGLSGGKRMPTNGARRNHQHQQEMEEEGKLGIHPWSGVLNMEATQRRLRSQAPPSQRATRIFSIVSNLFIPLNTVNHEGQQSMCSLQCHCCGWQIPHFHSGSFCLAIVSQ